MKRFQIEVDERELATVMAGLAYWRQDLLEGPDDESGLGVIPSDSVIATNGGRLTPLNPDEIDALFERFDNSLPVSA